MAQGTAAGTTKEPVIDDPLPALERRWREALKALDEATPKSSPDVSPGDMMKVIADVQEEMVLTPARTTAGVLVKLRLYADLNSRPAEPTIDRQPLGKLLDDPESEFDQAVVVSAMHDLERMTRTATVAETPPAQDAALFDALAEYDRLMAVEKDLEHRKDVFRPGIPEAEEATKAYEAACDDAMAAWERARKTPATTQAGLFAKLQAAIRFMADLGEEQLYEAEWCAIKDDVHRITGTGYCRSRS